MHCGVSRSKTALRKCVCQLATKTGCGAGVANYTNNLEPAPPLSHCDLLEMISSLASARSATSLNQFVWDLLFGV